MRKDNMHINENIGIVEKANAVEEIISFMFTDGDYTPYYKNLGVISAIAKNFILGVAFDDNESVFDCVVEDKELNNLVFDVFLDEDNLEYVNIMTEVFEFVDDKIEYIKQREIHGSYTLELIGEFLEGIVPAINSLGNLNLKELDPRAIEFGKKLISKFGNGEITENTFKDIFESVMTDFTGDKKEIVEKDKIIKDLNKTVRAKDREIKKLKESK